MKKGVNNIGFGLGVLPGLEKFKKEQEKIMALRKQKFEDLENKITHHMAQTHDTQYCPICKLYSKEVDEL